MISGFIDTEFSPLWKHTRSSRLRRRRNELSYRIMEVACFLKVRFFFLLITLHIAYGFGFVACISFINFQVQCVYCSYFRCAINLEKKKFLWTKVFHLVWLPGFCLKEILNKGIELQLKNKLLYLDSKSKNLRCFYIWIEFLFVFPFPFLNQKLTIFIHYVLCLIFILCSRSFPSWEIISW